MHTQTTTNYRKEWDEIGLYGSDEVSHNTHFHSQASYDEWDHTLQKHRATELAFSPQMRCMFW